MSGIAQFKPLYAGEVKAVTSTYHNAESQHCAALEYRRGMATSPYFDVRVHIHGPLEGVCSPVWLLTPLLPIAWQSCFAVLRPLCLMCSRTEWTHRSLHHTVLNEIAFSLFLFSFCADHPSWYCSVSL